MGNLISSEALGALSIYTLEDTVEVNNCHIKTDSSLDG